MFKSRLVIYLLINTDNLSVNVKLFNIYMIKLSFILSLDLNWALITLSLKATTKIFSKVLGYYFICYKNKVSLDILKGTYLDLYVSIVMFSFFYFFVQTCHVHRCSNNAKRYQSLIEWNKFNYFRKFFY